MPGGFGSAYYGTQHLGKKRQGFGAAFNSIPEPPVPHVAPEPEQHGSLFGNLLGDAVHAITGSGVAVAHAAGHLGSDVRHGDVGPTNFLPRTGRALVATGKSVAKTEAYQWGPLVRQVAANAKEDYYRATGNPDKARRFHEIAAREGKEFDRRFHAHPLGFLFDELTFGAGAAARVAAVRSLPEHATPAQTAHAAATGHYQGPLRTISGRAVEGGPEVTLRVLPRNAARANRIVATDTLLKRLDPETRLVGEQARVARAGKRQAERVRLALLALPELEAYVRARGKLSGYEGAAAQMLAKLPLPVDLEHQILKLKQVAAIAKTPAERQAALQQALLLEHPKFQAAYITPAAKVMDALEKGRALAARREENLAAAGFPAEHLAEAPYRHTRLVRGFEPGKKQKLEKKIEAFEAKLADKTGLYSADAVHAKLGRLRADLAALPEPASVDVLRDQIETAGRPLPYYLPDVLDAPGPLRRFVGGNRAARTVGLTPPAHDVKAWHGTLFQAGLLALRPDVLTPAYLRSVALTAGHEQHDWIRDHATVPVGKNEPLPLNHQWLREKRGQKIPAVLSGMEEHRANTGRAFPEIRDELETVLSGERGLTHPDEIARDAKGRRLAVPDAVVRELRVKAREDASVGRRFWDESTQVWRALVLNLRIPWLESNVVGNHVLYALRFAGLNGLRAYLGALADVKGVAAARRLVNLPETRRRFTDAELRELLPEQSRAGTFIGSQRPDSITARLPKPVKTVAKPVAGLVGFLPKLDRATEGFLRRAGVNTVLRGEAKAFARGMPKQTRDLKAAYARVSRDPAALELASREVNDALGNFLSLTPTEREGVRGLIPFYAWYREITRILLKLPLDAPGRTGLVAKLGQAQAQPDLPTYLQGDPTLGLDAQGRQELLALRNMNPFTTPLDLARAVTALTVPGATGVGAQQFVGNLNPFIGFLARQITLAYYGDSRARNVLHNFYSDFLLRLPEANVANNPDSPLYPSRTRKDLAKQFFGDPRRRIDPAVAADYHAEGR